jgi:thiamine-monophosphate kinase
MHEFDTIRDYFAPLAGGLAGADGLRDDGATLAVPGGYELVVTTDSLCGGRHFIGDEAPGDIARKALRVNLSDLAAMGAGPYAYQLALSLPVDDTSIDEAWLDGFTAALTEDQQHFGLKLSGGDLTSTKGPLTITITAMGLVPEGAGVHRHGARAGDHIVITGQVGDAAAGLRVALGELDADEDIAEALIARYRLPQITTEIAGVVRAHANAGIDISDGMHADLRHICAASGLSADIHTNTIPLSPECDRLLRVGMLDWPGIVSGGDDYKLLLAVPEDRLDALMRALKGHGLTPAVIGRFTDSDNKSPKVRIYDDTGTVLPVTQTGWQHF